MCQNVTIKFGTDGWRGVISDDFTFENVRKVAQAVADYYTLKAEGRKLCMAVGYDMRFLPAPMPVSSPRCSRTTALPCSCLTGKCRHRR